MDLLGSLQHHARNRSSHPAVVEGDRTITHHQFERLTASIAGRLYDAGIRAGDVVAVRVDASVAHLTIFYGLMRLGTVLLWIDPMWPQETTVQQLAFHRIKFVVTDRETSRFAGVSVIRVDETWQRANHALAAPAPPRDADLPAQIIHSSGTTGLPKAVVVGQSSYVQRSLRRAIAWGIGPESTYGSIIPLQFETGRQMAMLTLLVGGTVALFPAPLPVRRFPAALMRAHVTWTFLTPLRVRWLLAIARGDTPLLPFLQPLVVGSAPIAAAERDAARETITPHLIVSYGANECGLVTTAYPQDQRARPDSIGRVVSDIEAEVVDEQDRPVAPGVAGIMRVRAPDFPTGYADDPGLAQSRFHGGWFYPGDIVAIDEDGYVHFKGRIDDVINIDGVKVHPAEIEAVLLRHDAVAEAAVVGVRDKAQRELPAAFILVKRPIEPQEVIAHCRRHLAANQTPRVLLQVSELPRNAMGKVERTRLREIAQKAMDRQPRKP